MDAADGVDAADDARQGQVLADALKNASDATGSNVATGSAVMFGDWNEFEWASTKPNCYPAGIW